MHTYKINLGTLALFPIPLLPLEEQKRIVQVLDEALSFLS